MSKLSDKIKSVLDVTWFKPKKGRNKINIIPYLITTNHHPQKMEKGFEDYLLDVFVHRGIGPSSGPKEPRETEKE